MNAILNWRDAYETSDSIIYLLDAERRIVRCNPAWDRFAVANGGRTAIAAEVKGRSIMEVVPDQLKDFYLTAYENVRRFRRDWWHIFECSSQNLTRMFQMRILPCEDGSLLTMNTLISETPMEIAGLKAVENYMNDGIAVMCSHCRRVQRRNRPGTWDWVPELFVNEQVLITFALCDFCTAYHYGRR